MQYNSPDHSSQLVAHPSNNKALAKKSTSLERQSKDKKLAEAHGRNKAEVVPKLKQNDKADRDKGAKSRYKPHIDSPSALVGVHEARTPNDRFQDAAGRSIVSKITRSLGSLKTLSGVDAIQTEGNRNFNLFSHHALLKDGQPLELSYKALREGILELYLSVKIRSDEEIDAYNEEFFNEEKRQH